MRTVYITEDDASIRQLVTYALKTADIEAVGLETGAALFDAVAAKKPDLLILDIMLPDIDGISILRKIRSNPYTAELPVLMLTAKSAEYDKVNALDLGADDYVTKPFSPSELVAALLSPSCAAALAGKLLVHTLFTVTSYGVTRIIPALITPSTETARIAAAQRRPTLRCTRGAQSFSRSICKT